MTAPMRACLVLATSLAAGGAQFAAEVTPRDIQRATAMCERGTKALKAGDIAKARTSYQEALKIIPTLPDALLGLGHVAMREQKFDQALGAYEQGKAAFAEMGVITFDIRVQRYTATQRQITAYRDMLRDLRSSLESDRTDPATVQMQITQVEAEIHKLEAVEMPVLSQARETPGEAYFHVGNALFRLDRIDEAITAWETCATKSPEFGLVQINLAVAYWRKERFEDAKRCIARADALGIPINPNMKADLEKAAAGRAAARAPAPSGSASDSAAVQPSAPAATASGGPDKHGTPSAPPASNP